VLTNHLITVDGISGGEAPARQVCRPGRPLLHVGGLGLDHNGGAVHAGGLEQGAEHLGGPFGAVEGDLAVPAACAAVVTGHRPDLVQLGVELLLGQVGVGKIRTCGTGAAAGVILAGSAAWLAGFPRRSSTGTGTSAARRQRLA